MKIEWIKFFSVIVIFLAGCKILEVSQEHYNADSETDSGEIYGNIKRESLDFKNLFIKRYDCQISENLNWNEFYGSIKIIKGKKIILTVKSGIGLEAVRVMITPDSVIVIDRVSKEVIIGGFSDWEKHFGLIGNYSTLESLVINDNALINNIIDKGSYENISKKLDNEGNIIIKDNKENILYETEVLLDPEMFRIIKYLRENQFNEMMEVNYKNWTDFNGYKLPLRLKAQLNINNSERTISLFYRRIEFNAEFKEKFIIPDGYNVIIL